MQPLLERQQAWQQEQQQVQPLSGHPQAWPQQQRQPLSGLLLLAWLLRLSEHPQAWPHRL